MVGILRKRGTLIGEKRSLRQVAVGNRKGRSLNPLERVIRRRINKMFSGKKLRGKKLVTKIKITREIR